ncbi:MAG TPA: hypothetical protein PL055_05805, partial [Methanobacterium sp.]|nr:hypothetical protein [Methanobacterium sp.]
MHKGYCNKGTAFQKVDNNKQPVYHVLTRPSQRKLEFHPLTLYLDFLPGLFHGIELQFYHPAHTGQQLEEIQ